MGVPRSSCLPPHFASDWLGFNDTKQQRLLATPAFWARSPSALLFLWSYDVEFSSLPWARACIWVALPKVCPFSLVSPPQLSRKRGRYLVSARTLGQWRELRLLERLSRFVQFVCRETRTFCDHDWRDMNRNIRAQLLGTEKMLFLVHGVNLPSPAVAYGVAMVRTVCSYWLPTPVKDTIKRKETWWKCSACSSYLLESRGLPCMLKWFSFL